MSAYPRHLEQRLQRMRSELGLRSMSLHDVWRRVLANISIARRQPPTDANLAAIAEEFHADAYVWDGMLYPSIVAVARALDLNESSIRQCIERDMTFGEAIRHLLAYDWATKVSFDGIDYPSVNAASRALKLNQGSLQRCIDKGMTADEAILHLLRIKTEGRYEKVQFDGTVYPSASAAARALGLEQTTLWRDINKGMATEAAIRRQLALKEKVFRFDGINYPSVNAA